MLSEQTNLGNRTAGDSKCQELGEEGEREGKINQNHRNVNTTETLQAHLRGKKKKSGETNVHKTFSGEMVNKKELKLLQKLKVKLLSKKALLTCTLNFIRDKSISQMT